MPPLEDVLAGGVLVAATFYAVLAGADFGGGVWDMLATGPRAKKQRDLIADALAPIWEANHVWLILVIVMLFVAFPSAYAAIMISLHIPLTLVLVGIVLRGAAFTFRHYDVHSDDVQRRWGRLFAIASTLTPIMLGICVGTLASGKMPVSPNLTNFSDAFKTWLAPYPIAVGFLALAAFSFIAAVFLAVEATDRDLKEDFRKRALLAAVAVFVTAWVAFFLAGEGAPILRRRLLGTNWAWAFHILTGLMATTAMYSLWTRKYLLARVTATLQIVLILFGWGVSQYPWMLPPDPGTAQLGLTIQDAASKSQATLKMLFWALVAGVFILVPSFAWLFMLFKGKKAFRVMDTIMLKKQK